MGLDMYLYKKEFVNPVELEDTVKIISKLSPDGEYEYHSSW